MGANILRVWKSHGLSLSPLTAALPPPLTPLLLRLFVLGPLAATTPTSPLLQPSCRSFPNISLINSMRKPLLRETDDVITCKIGGCGPDFPFKSSEEYYAVCLSPSPSSTWTSEIGTLTLLRLFFFL